MFKFYTSKLELEFELPNSERSILKRNLIKDGTVYTVNQWAMNRNTNSQ